MTVPSTADARPLASMSATLPTGVGLVVVLLLVGSAVAVVVRFLPLPYESVLALIGLLVGAKLGPGAFPGVSGDLILFVLLPGLLFEAGFRLRWPLLRQNLAAVLALATVGVGLTTTVVGTLGHWALGLTVPFAILLGAMVAPTDPVAVTALLQRLGMPERLRNLFEAESLVNDGTGVVVFTIALAATTAGAFTPTSIVLDFVRLAGGGIALGVALGFAISFVTSRIDDVRVELSLTAVAAYGGYLLGNLAGVSGILVVVAAAIVLGNFGRPHGMSARTQEAADIFWDYVAFVLNTIVFVLIGLAVPLQQLLADPPAILVGIAVALVARAAAVYVLLPPLARRGQRVPLRWQHLLVWGGLRGAVATALALSLAGRGDGYDQVRALTYGVVLASILLQGVTFRPVARFLLRDRNPSSA
jgi:monovalent cation:H+ antiporter, CPA1 family